MTVPNRNYQSPEYRYGFQGQEKDDEVKGSGNSLNYKYRMHDPRIGRFFAIDPITYKYPWYTPYQFSGNTPIMSIELEGLEPIVYDGILVGYTVQKGFGVTQIAKDINDPITQERYGYFVIEPINARDIVLDNYDKYAKNGNWKTPGEITDMLFIDRGGNTIDSEAHRNLNINEGDQLFVHSEMIDLERSALNDLYLQSSGFIDEQTAKMEKSKKFHEAYEGLVEEFGPSGNVSKPGIKYKEGEFSLGKPKNLPRTNMYGNRFSSGKIGARAGAAMGANRTYNDYLNYRRSMEGLISPDFWKEQLQDLNRVIDNIKKGNYKSEKPTSPVFDDKILDDNISIPTNNEKKIKG